MNNNGNNSDSPSHSHLIIEVFTMTMTQLDVSFTSRETRLMWINSLVRPNLSVTFQYCYNLRDLKKYKSFDDNTNFDVTADIFLTLENKVKIGYIKSVDGDTISFYICNALDVLPAAQLRKNAKAASKCEHFEHFASSKSEVQIMKSNKLEKTRLRNLESAKVRQKEKSAATARAKLDALLDSEREAKREAKAITQRAAKAMAHATEKKLAESQKECAELKQDRIRSITRQHEAQVSEADLKILHEEIFTTDEKFITELNAEVEKRQPGLTDFPGYLAMQNRLSNFRTRDFLPWLENNKSIGKFSCTLHCL
jgi:hypothetical protein